MPGGVYSVQLLDGQSTSSVYSGLCVVLVEMMTDDVVGVPLDVDVVNRLLVLPDSDEAVFVADNDEAVTPAEDNAAAVVSSVLCLLLRVPPTPPPTAAAITMITTMATTIQNILIGSPHILLFLGRAGLSLET